MPANTFRMYNFASPTTATPTLVTTGTAIKTMLQVQTGASKGISIVEWGLMADAATTLRAELIDTAAVAATVTAGVTGDVVRMNQPNDDAPTVAFSTTATGYTSTVEGTVAASRLLDFTVLSTAGAQWHQYPLGREPHMAPSRNLRIRVTALAAVNLACYIEWEE